MNALAPPFAQGAKDKKKRKKKWNNGNNLNSYSKVFWPKLNMVI
jgi:hypothetical protein